MGSPRLVHCCQKLETIQACDEYVDYRIVDIIKAVHPDVTLHVDHEFLDDKFIWYRTDENGKRHRFAAMVIFPPGTLARCLFEPILAKRGQEELELRKHSKPILNTTLKAIAMKNSLTKLRDLHNDYGCCNMALCDFDNFLPVDARPLTKGTGEHAEAALIYAGKECARRAAFQNVFLGFLERGIEWMVASSTSDRGRGRGYSFHT
jgi:hypothetical protein